MKRTSTYVRTICEIGMFAALGFVLDELQGILSKGIFINGGSIGFAMVAVLVIGYRRGWLSALLTGLIMGGLDIATSAYIIHPAQLLLDYILPYALVAVGCISKILFDKSKTEGQAILWIAVGTTVGGLCKLLSHYLAGVIFWADSPFAWGLAGMNIYLYCFIYNIAFIGPSIVLSIALMAALYLRVPFILKPNDKQVDRSKNKDAYPIVYTSICFTGGMFTFVWFLIDYIKSFSSYKDGNAYGYDFNPDSMILTVLGSFFVVLGIFSFIHILKKNFSPLFSAGVGLTIVSMSLIYAIARLIRTYVKNKSHDPYWLWFGVGLFTVLCFLALFLFFYFKKKNKKKANVASQSA